MKRKLSPATSSKVKALLALGMKQSDIAVGLGVSRQYVWQIKHNKSYYKHKGYKVQKFLLEQEKDVWIPLNEISYISIWQAARKLGLSTTMRKGRFMIITT
jgi:transcriptional regulator with XRE-family HTH domain